MGNLSAVEPMTLEGPFARVEPLAESHAAGLFANGQDESMWKWMPRGPFTSEADALQFIRKAREDAADGKQLPFAILTAQGREVVGSTRYLDISAYNESIEIGWTFLHPSQWGSAIAVDVNYMLARHAFDELGAGRVWFKTDAKNERANFGLKKAGVIFEGILRRHMRVREDYIRDTSVYAVIKDEWPERRLHAEALLAAAQRK